MTFGAWPSSQRAVSRNGSKLRLRYSRTRKASASWARNTWADAGVRPRPRVRKRASTRSKSPSVSDIIRSYQSPRARPAHRRPAARGFSPHSRPSREHLEELELGGELDPVAGVLPAGPGVRLHPPPVGRVHRPAPGDHLLEPHLIGGQVRWRGQVVPQVGVQQVDVGPAVLLEVDRFGLVTGRLPVCDVPDVEPHLGQVGGDGRHGREAGPDRNARAEERHNGPALGEGAGEDVACGRGLWGHGCRAVRHYGGGTSHGLVAAFCTASYSLIPDVPQVVCSAD